MNGGSGVLEKNEVQLNQNTLTLYQHSFFLGFFLLLELQSSSSCPCKVAMLDLSHTGLETNQKCVFLAGSGCGGCVLVPGEISNKEGVLLVQSLANCCNHPLASTYSKRAVVKLVGQHILEIKNSLTLKKKSSSRHRQCRLQGAYKLTITLKFADLVEFQTARILFRAKNNELPGDSQSKL